MPGSGDRRRLCERGVYVGRVEEAELEGAAARPDHDRELADDNVPAFVRAIRAVVDRHVPVDGRDPHLMITGWYDDGQGWKQCALKGWRDAPKGKSLSCQTPSGGTMTVTCTKGRCARP